MLITTTNNIENAQITNYLGVVNGETILGANFFKDIAAGLTDFFGGRSGSYEKSIIEARQTSINEMTEQAKRLGADAIVAVDFDYEVLGNEGSMLMVTCSGTAVKLSR